MKIQAYPLVLICVLLGFATVQGQDLEEIRIRLAEFQVRPGWLSSLKEEDAVHYYKEVSETGTATGPVLMVSEYNPRKPLGKRWNLISVNDAKPSKQDLKKFKQINNQKLTGLTGRIDSTTFQVVRDDDDFYVVSFRLIKETLPSKFRFLGDCDAKIYCRKDQMKVSFGEFDNYTETHVRGLAVPEFHMEAFFVFDEVTGTYLHSEETIVMKVMFMGQLQPMEIRNTMTDYKVVK